MKFLNGYSIRYINLESRKDRDAYITNHFKTLGIDNFKRVESIYPAKIPDSILDQGKSLGCRDVEVACVLSNLESIKDFLSNSSDKYGFFCEDDADVSNFLSIGFTVDELFNSFSNDIGCIQLGISTREDLEIDFYAHKRKPWDFNTSTYVLSRDYAKEIINKYYENNSFTFNNFKPIEFIEYRNSTPTLSTPVAEFVVYGEKTITIPLVTYTLSESSIQMSSEVERQNKKSREDFLHRWESHTSIGIDDVISSSGNFFSDSILNIDLIKSDVKVVIPWRQSESRVEIFNFLVSWYSLNFPDWKIIFSDSGSETFNLSASRNIGIEKALSLGAEIVLVSDADFFPSKDSLIKSILNAEKNKEITMPYKIYNEISYEGTRMFLLGNHHSVNMFLKSNKNPEVVDGKVKHFWVCSGLFVIPKNVYNEIQGFDENFVGWGPEDQDYHKKYFDKYGKLFSYIDGIGCSLEHSRNEWNNSNNENLEYFKRKHGVDYVL